MRDIRIVNMSSGQRADSDKVFRRIGEIGYRNIGALSRIGIFDSGKALVTSGLRVEASSGMTVSVTAGNMMQRLSSGDLMPVIAQSAQTVTLDAASGISRIDIIECQVRSVQDKDDVSQIILDPETGIISLESIKRDVKYYLVVQKKTNSSTATAATSGVLTGTVAIPGTIDLSSNYLLHLADGEDGSFQEIDLRGSTPEATTRGEIVAAINAAVGRVMASTGGGDVVVLTGAGDGITSYFTIQPPVTNPDADALETVFGLSSAGAYEYIYRGVNAWIKLAEIDVGAATVTITNSLIRNIDQKDTWASDGDEVIVQPPIFQKNEPEWNEWSDLRTYDAGEIAYIGDVQFVSLAGSNLDKDPVFETDWWKPAPDIKEVLEKYNKAVPDRGGMNNIHNIRNAAYKKSFLIGKYKLGSRTLEAYGVHIDGSVVTGDATLEDILTGYKYIDLMAPDSLGTRTLLNYQGRVPRVVTSASGGTGDSLAVSLVQEDQMQGHWHAERVNAYNVNADSRYPTDYRAGNDATGAAVNHLEYTQVNVKSTVDAITDGVNGTPRTGLETRMKNWVEGVPYIVVIKEVA